MSRITLYHNINRSGMLGFGYGDDPHYLVKVFAFDSSQFGYLSASHSEILRTCFDEFNIGTTQIAREYRARRLRSLSVGDVVDIDGHAYACGRFSWDDIRGGQMTVLDGTAAENAIRAQLDLRPDEELTITVPLS